MKFLILGVNGMVGHMVARHLDSLGHDVTGFARSRSPFVKTIIGDAFDYSLLKAAVTSQNADLVVNCIGSLNSQAEENKHIAAYLNGCLPHLLADMTKNSPARVIHISTDCVFSGDRGGYTEADRPDGTTFYAKSKALGELNDGRNLTLRQSIVGPDLGEEGIGLLNWFMHSTGEVKGYTGVNWTGLTSLELAKVIHRAAVSGAFGLVNMVPDSSVSKYELLCLFNKYMRADSVRITPFASYVSDKSLIRTNFEFDYKVPDYDKMIWELSQYIKANYNIYPKAYRN